MALLKRNGRAGRAQFAALLFCAAWVGPGLSLVPAAQAPALVNTQAVYAAFTVNLTRFVTWPDGAFERADSPLVIGSFSRDPVSDELEAAVRNERVEGRSLQMLRIQSLDDLVRCHVIFLSRGLARPAVLARVASKPILTVSDAEGFLEFGGHVRFDSQGTGTRLRMSVANLKESGLECRAQLLRLAAAP